METINDVNNNRNIIIKQLNEYLLLDTDWDGYNGVPPDKQTIEDTIVFLKLLPNHIINPKIMLGNSGTVGLYWENDYNYIEVCFDGDTSYSYYCVNDKLEIGSNQVWLSDAPNEFNPIGNEMLSFFENFKGE